MIRFLSCMAGVLLTFACNTSDSRLAEAEQISKSVISQYVPDGREDIFKIRFTEKGTDLVVTGETTLQEGKNALLASLNNSKFNVIDSIRVLPYDSLGTKTWGLVTVSVCNIRTKPADEAEMASQALLGTPVRILKKSKSWFLIQTPDRYIGWVDDRALHQTDSTGMAAWKDSKRVIYLPLCGNSFHPETKEAVTDLVAGNILKSDTIIKNEYVLEMPDGRKLTIPSSDAIDFEQWKKSTSPTTTSIINSAKSLLGRPYLWGGTSSKGVDCSGFTKTVYFLNGIILARDASLQFRHGEFSDPMNGNEKLIIGDLVFFGKKAEGDHPAKATHVGIYLGNGLYINSSGYVRIDSFNPADKNYSKKRADTWLGGRTVLGSEGSNGIVKVKDHPWY
jgi:gamma-D-glutamyl-L-lysine dipeptidyl-peptidase